MRNLWHVQLPISIHAPPRGATRTVTIFFVIRLISIHAPPRGATGGCTRNHLFQGISIHAPPRGATFDFCHMLRRLEISIHAPPRGATCPEIICAKPRRYFNSRPSARGDNPARNGAPSAHVFQFTPLREGRPHDYFTPSNALIFQFTPLREGRRALCQNRYVLPNFNSRPSARGDSKRYAISANLLFNPYKSAWLNNRATQFVEIILVIFHRIIA